jgi:hypothetical protein
MHGVRFPVLVVTLMSTVLVLPACWSGESASQTDAVSSKPVEGYGIALEIPRGWEAHFAWPSPAYVRTVHLASFALPARLDGRGHEAEQQMRSGDVYINIGADPTFVASSPLQSLVVRRSALETDWEGKVPKAATRASCHALIDGRQVQVWVTFGSVPDDAMLGRVNTVLSTLMARPASTER